MKNFYLQLSDGKVVTIDGDVYRHIKTAALQEKDTMIRECSFQRGEEVSNFIFLGECKGDPFEANQYTWFS